MILNPGEKIHLIHRRFFEKDIRRHFVGQVEDCECGIARVLGHVFVIDDLNRHLFVKRPDTRTKLISLTTGSLIINVLPETVDLENVRYELKDGNLWVTDGKEWKMDVKEFGWG